MSKPPRLTGCCGQIIPHDQLCACQIEGNRARKARHDQHRLSATKRGYGTQWRKLRAEFLILHPIYRYRGDAANTVDHITPHRGDQRLFWNWNNWQALCTPCHSHHKQRLKFAQVLAFSASGIISLGENFTKSCLRRDRVRIRRQHNHRLYQFPAVPIA